jgi:membrane protein YdbS with pleckstrin-like domain
MELLSGEEVVWQGRPSWRSRLAFYLKWGIIALLPGVLGSVLEGPAGVDLPISVWWLWLISLLLIALVVLGGWIQRIGTQYTITNERINIRHGLLSRSDHSTSYERLQNVSTRQSPLERMLGVGSVDFDTAASDDFEFAFLGIDDPAKLQKLISELQRGGQSTSQSSPPVSQPTRQ